MKKILCILFIALCCCGCQKENTFENSNQEPSDASTQEKKKDNTILCYKIDSNGGTDHMIIHDENDNILKETTTYSIKILDNNSANDVLKKLNEDCDKIETENIKAICYVSQSDNTL